MRFGGGEFDVSGYYMGGVARIFGIKVIVKSEAITSQNFVYVEYCLYYLLCTRFACDS